MDPETTICPSCNMEVPHNETIWSEYHDTDVCYECENDYNDHTYYYIYEEETPAERRGYTRF